jgi:hypothetical protein
MQSLKTISRITGVGYLLIFVSGFFANFYVLETLVVDNDATTTVENLLNNSRQFHGGLAAFTVMVLIDLLLAFPLYKLLAPVDVRQSTIGAWLRVINALLFGVALVSLFKVSLVLDGAGNNASAIANSIENDVMVLFERFNYIWVIGLVFFGFHLLVLGRLVYRSGYMPKLIGVFLVIAGIGYLIDSSAQLFMGEYDRYKDVFEMIVVIPGIVGELSLTVWLLVGKTGK